MALEIFQKGELARIRAEFRNESSELYDPSTVKIRVQPPRGALVEYVYGVGGQLIKDADGKFHIDILTDQAGTWRYRWNSLGGVGVQDGRFFVLNQGGM